MFMLNVLKNIVTLGYSGYSKRIRKECFYNCLCISFLTVGLFLATLGLHSVFKFTTLDFFAGIGLLLSFNWVILSIMNFLNPSEKQDVIIADTILIFRIIWFPYVVLVYLTRLFDTLSPNVAKYGNVLTYFTVNYVIITLGLWIFS